MRIQGSIFTLEMLLENDSIPINVKQSYFLKPNEDNIFILRLDSFTSSQEIKTLIEWSSFLLTM